MLAALLVACGSKPRSEPHERETGGADHHEDEAREHAEKDGLLRIDHEMLRDLRVTVTKVESRAAGERVTSLGELEVNQEAYAEIAAPVAARVVKVLVRPGDVVKAGQALVELHSPELGKARAGYQAARARADVAQKLLARKQELAADKLVPEKELREAEAAAASAEADVKVAHAELRAFGTVSDTGADASTFTLASPVPGTVIERTAVMGQLADPSRTLFRVGDLSHLWLIAHVFERDAVRLAPAGKATVTFAAMPGESVDASVAFVGREVEPASRTIPVRLDVPNPRGLLRPGMSATVTLPLGDVAQSVMAVPLAAVQRVGEKWAVFLPRPEEGVFEVRTIGRGRELGGEVEILSGLQLGESVVVDGAFLLKAESDKARGEGGEHDHD
jgi:cobalt-zinc-cadmium efflux system membrane fusion protein